MIKQIKPSIAQLLLKLLIVAQMMPLYSYGQISDVRTTIERLEEQERKENLEVFSQLIEIFKIQPKFSSGWEVWGRTEQKKFLQLDTPEGANALTGGALDAQKRDAQARAELETGREQLSEQSSEQIRATIVESETLSLEVKQRQENLTQQLGEQLADSGQVVASEEQAKQIEQEKKPDRKLGQKASKALKVEVITASGAESVAQLGMSYEVNPQTREELFTAAQAQLEAVCPDYKKFAIVQTQYPIRRVCGAKAIIKEHEETYQSLDNEVFVREDKVHLSEALAARVSSQSAELKSGPAEDITLADYFANPSVGSLDQERLKVYYLKEGEACIQTELQMQAERVLTITSWENYEKFGGDCLNVERLMARTIEYQVEDIKNRLQRATDLLTRVTKNDYYLASPVRLNRIGDFTQVKEHERPSHEFILRPGLRAMTLAEKVSPFYFNQGEPIIESLHWTPAQAIAIMRRDVVPAFRRDLAVIEGFLKVHSKVRQPVSPADYHSVLVREMLLGPLQKLACLIGDLQSDNRQLADGKILLFGVHDQRVPFLSQREANDYDVSFKPLMKMGSCPRKPQEMTFETESYARALGQNRLTHHAIKFDDNGVEVYDLGQ